MKKLSIVIPVYNEIDTIEQVFDAVEKSSALGLEKEIIVVDDVSTDGTREYIKGLGQKPGFKFLFNEKNIGKGGSLRHGLEKSTGDFALIQDADLEYDPNDYGKLIEPLQSGKAQVVYGSRYSSKKHGSKQSLASFIANKVLTLVSNIFTGQNITDMETCYKCFTREALGKILPKLVSTRFDIEPEITARVSSAGFHITEVPVSYNPRTNDKGKKIKWTDGFPALWAILKFNMGNFFKIRKYFLTLLVSLAILSFISVYYFPEIKGDTPSYIHTIQVMDSGVVPVGFQPNRLMTTFLGLEIILGLSKIFGSVYGSWLFLNLFFYCAISITFYFLIFRIFKCRRTALFGSVLVAGSYAMIFFAIAYLMDAPGWAFYLLSLYFLFAYSESKRKKDLLLSALAVGIGGLFKEYAFLGTVSIAVYLIGESLAESFGKNWRLPKKFFMNAVQTAFLALAPIALVFLYIYLKFDYTYLDWLTFADEYYFYESRFVEFIKAIGSLWNLVGLLFIGGLWVLFKKWKNISSGTKLFILSMFVSTLPVFTWPAITQRILFPTVPFAVLISCFFFKKYENRWYLFVPVVLVYIVLSFFTDRILAGFNLPF